MTPTGMLIVVPSTLAVGETFALRLKLRGPVREIPPAGGWNTPKPALAGPFNVNVERGIRFHDDCLPAFAGRLRADGGAALAGPAEIAFDGENQGSFPGDTRPIGTFGGFRFTRPGFHFVRVIHEPSGLEGWSNPVRVTPEPPVERIVWGDPHWQTFFSDGIRCPEELYAFARDEAFLDFGAVSDHMEAVTDRQWDYFQAVTNDCNEPGRFVTLVGQEWTNHNPAVGAPGHRNVYVRGGRAPVLRSNDPNCETLDKLWRRLDEAGFGPDDAGGIPTAVAIPHHPANVVMGVDWDAGWNPTYETAVEMYSVWGNSEKPAAAGNPRPIRALDGEMPGRHVRDALARGYRLGFVGGGDIHDGRPGDDLHAESYPPEAFSAYRQGLTAARVPALTRENVFDAIRERRTYAATRSRIYLDVRLGATGRQTRATHLHVQAASEDGGVRATLVRNGRETPLAEADGDGRVIDTSLPVDPLASDEYLYVRVDTAAGEMAWSSPLWGPDR